MPALILIAWLTPIAVHGDDRGGSLRARRTGRQTFLPLPTLLVIQITTVGNEETVNEIIRRIRGYQLELPHVIWSRPSRGRRGTIQVRTRSSSFPRSSSVMRRTRHGPVNTHVG